MLDSTASSIPLIPSSLETLLLLSPSTPAAFTTRQQPAYVAEVLKYGDMSSRGPSARLSRESRRVEVTCTTISFTRAALHSIVNPQHFTVVRLGLLISAGVFIFTYPVCLAISYRRSFPCHPQSVGLGELLLAFRYHVLFRSSKFINLFMPLHQLVQAEQNAPNTCNITEQESRLSAGMFSPFLSQSGWHGTTSGLSFDESSPSTVM